MTLATFQRPLLMIGCGNMAGAMLSRWLDAGLAPAHVTVVDPGRGEAPAPGVTLLAKLPNTLPDSAVILLGVKPQALPDVAPMLSPLLGESHLVVSMLAGVTVEQLRASLGRRAAMIRIMPNTPVALGKGVVAFFADDSAGADSLSDARRLFAPLGLVERMGDEAQFNLLTALTGCGPAFVFRFIDALSQAAVSLGMEELSAARLALATVEGAAALASHADESPAILADRVASKGGMTREGLDVLDENGRLVSLLTDMMRAAEARGVELERLAAG